MRGHPLKESSRFSDDSDATLGEIRVMDFSSPTLLQSTSGQVHMPRQTSPKSLGDKDQTLTEVAVIDSASPSPVKHREPWRMSRTTSMQTPRESAQGLEELQQTLLKEFNDQLSSKLKSAHEDIIQLVEHARSNVGTLAAEVTKLEALARDRATEIDAPRTAVETIHEAMAATGISDMQAAETLPFITRGELRSVTERFDAKLEEIRALRATAHNIPHAGMWTSLSDSTPIQPDAAEHRMAGAESGEAKASHLSSRQTLNLLYETSRRRRERSSTPDQPALKCAFPRVRV